MSRRRAAIMVGVVAVGWWRWHAQGGRWHTPESVILHFAWERRAVREGVSPAQSGAV